MNIHQQSRRSKERYVKEAIECVGLWRDIFLNGHKDEAGNITKVSLNQAADLVNVPKKTLEDYYAILRKAEQMINLDDVLNEKMGYLRNLIKENKKQPISLKQCEDKRTTNGNEFQNYQPMSWDNMVIETDQFCSPSLHQFTYNQREQREENCDITREQREDNYNADSSSFMQIEDHYTLFPNERDLLQTYGDEEFNIYYPENVYRGRSLSRNSAGAQEEWIVPGKFKNVSGASPDE